MAHCDIGEYEGSCKYGEDDCPALAPRALALSIIAESWSNRGFPETAESIAAGDVWVADAMLAFAAAYQKAERERLDQAWKAMIRELRHAFIDGEGHYYRECLDMDSAVWAITEGVKS
jgi:hypothetical protein